LANAPKGLANAPAGPGECAENIFASECAEAK
jgi:hypothetical protein